MGLFSRKKIANSDIQYIATAKALLEHCLNIDESKELSEDLRLSKEEFRDFHVNKRFLAIKTVLYTAVISMDVQRRNKFVEIFIKEKDARENINGAPKNIQEMLRNINEAHDGAYHSAFEHITGNINQYQCEPVEALCEGFTITFCAFLDKEGSDIYQHIGKKIFYKHHNLAMRFLPELND
jgi:hypothetical protein